MMDGRVKTLHPEGPRRPARRARQSRACGGDGEHRIAPIDLVVVNLYPFLNTVDERRRPRHDHREYRHRRPVDGALGGQEPRHVAIVTDPADYAACSTSSMQRRRDRSNFASARGQGLCADRGL
jgi:phosphoribosylaminoimidazolecarboxamide formyltransferase/IMP cyclohydrolase